MAHDADFVGDHLRLVSFLRVVQKGMPQRPSRFKRRIRPTDKQSHTNFQVDSGQVPEPVPYVKSVYDVPRCPTPDQHTGYAISDDETHDTHSINEQYLNMRPVEKVRKQANSSRVKAASKSLGSSCTRKKGLLMHRLALLRTTTPNGLPEPHDTNAVNAPLITDVDPIDDRQTFASLRSNQHGSVSDYDFVSAAKVVSFPMANRTQRYNSPRVKPEKTPASFTQQLPVSTRSRQQPHAVQGGFDGFMGSELEFVSKRRAIRPGHHPMTKKKKPANEVGAKLALASGLLPIPAAENLQEPVFTEHSGVLLNQDNIF